MNHSLSNESTSSKVLIIGIGGVGIGILKHLNLRETESWIHTLALDTDSKSLEHVRADSILNLFTDYKTSETDGCCGNIEEGADAVYKKREILKRIIQGYALVVFTGALGGGTATGGLRPLAKITEELKIPTVALLLKPFSFEQRSRRRNAETCLDEILPRLKFALTLPADLLYANCLSESTPISDAFELAIREIAGMLQGLVCGIQGENLLGINFSAYMNKLKGKHTICGIGVGQSSAEDGYERGMKAISQMFESPFLGGIEHINHANAVILMITCGKDATVSEIKRMLETIVEQFPDNATIISGVCTLEAAEGKIYVMTIPIRYHDNVIKKTSESPLLQNGEEGILNLTIYSKGIFEKTLTQHFQGTDYDIPTYQRKNMTIRAREQE